uniref:Uncharacterized protein n=1 Tax=Arundo donax TaxID=35708 RepID=A0A0A9CE31_ARUDO
MHTRGARRPSVPKPQRSLGLPPGRSTV